MTPEQFADLVKQGYNRIPVTREILADLETPLSCYLKLARGPYSYLNPSKVGKNGGATPCWACLRRPC